MNWGATVHLISHVKPTQKNKAWTKGLQSLQINMYFINRTDWGVKVMDRLYTCLQEVAYRMVGQFAYHFKVNEEKIKKWNESIDKIIRIVDDWNWRQMNIELSFSEYLEEQAELFTMMPLLYLHLAEFLNHDFKGIKMNSADVWNEDYDSTDQEYWYGGDNGGLDSIVESSTGKYV